MGEVVGKTVTTGKRNVNHNDDMAPKSTSLPIKKFEAPPATMGPRDTVLDAGGTTKPTGR